MDTKKIKRREQKNLLWKIIDSQRKQAIKGQKNYKIAENN